MDWFIIFILICIPWLMLLALVCRLPNSKTKQDVGEHKSSIDSIKCCITEETVRQDQQYQQSYDTIPVEDTIRELSKNETTFLANKQTIELTNIISNIVAKEFNSSVQDYGNPVEEFVQESVDICKEQQVSDMPVQQEVSDNVNNVDLNQYHAYNNEYNQPTYKKPSPIVSVGKDNACNIGYTQRDNVDVAPGTANPVVHKIIQNQTNKNINEMLRLQRNRLYLAPTKKLTPEGRYNLYVEQIARKHDQYIDFKLRLNRTIKLAKDAGLTEEIIDDILDTGDKDKYLITGVNKYE